MCFDRIPLKVNEIKTMEIFFMKLKIGKHYTTAEFAELLGVKPETPRSSLCKKGHYLGIVPKKMPNGRLLWPESGIAKIYQES